MRPSLTLACTFQAIGSLPLVGHAQSPLPAPGVEWRSVAWLDKKPPFGTSHVYNGTTQSGNDITAVHVDEATFTHCPRGIRMEGVSNAAITRNNFSVNDFTGSYYQFSVPYGVYSDQCTGYKIENNVFTFANHSVKAKSGLVIKDRGPNSNTVYNNCFDGFYEQNSTALLIQGKNAAPNGQLTGLEVRCNEFGQHGADNRYDVALTGSNPLVQKNQGHLFQGQTDFTAPAGNLFSLQGGAESDWMVSGSSNVVTYYHHNGTNQSWVPQYIDPNFLLPQLAGGPWPTARSQACPDHFADGGVMLVLQQSAEAGGELTESQSAYDATKDNGDTYSLEGYVNDPGHSSAQVRSALQSVAPNVGTEVWSAAFSRQPAMDPWHLTQALLANSPLQAEVMQLCYDSDLEDFYYNLVVSAQNGQANPLSVLESAISQHAGDKAEALTGLGRMSWLDSTDVGLAVEQLKQWHDSLPADNGPSVEAGYYSAKGDMPALAALAGSEKLSSSTPKVWELLERFAAMEQAGGADSLGAATVQWLIDLANDRWTIGSAQASAWLQTATGAAPLEEVIILPTDMQLRSSARHRERDRASHQPLLLDAYPNPSDGPVHVVCNVPEGVSKASLQIRDLNARLLYDQPVEPGMGVAVLQAGAVAAGIYLAELRLDGVRAGQVKLALQ